MRHVSLTLTLALTGMLGACMDPPDVATSEDTAQPSVVGAPHQGQNLLATLTGANLRSAYKITGHASSSVKVGVIIAGGYAATRVTADVSAFRTHNSLHTGTAPQIVNSSGNTSPLPATISAQWEQAGDAGLAVALALADDVSPILVEAASASWSDLDVAIKRAKTMGATRIVLPFSLGSDPGDGTTFATGALYFAGTDVGASVTFPALSAKVIAVAPTTLQPDMSTRGFSEVALSGSAVGCSTRAKPAFQADSICPSNRTVPDMSAVGDSQTPVQIYYTPSGGSQATLDVSGPGVGAALAAGWIALDPTATVANMYANPSNLFDLNTAGFDATTGLGSPNQDATF